MNNGITKTWIVWSNLYFTDFMKKKHCYDFSNEEQGKRIVNIQRSKKAGYIIVSIIRNTAEECVRELIGQLSDGIFENYGGYVEKEITGTGVL